MAGSNNRGQRSRQAILVPPYLSWVVHSMTKVNTLGCFRTHVDLCLKQMIPFKGVLMLTNQRPEIF